MATKTIDEVFAEFQQLPDWNRFPMPEVFYTHFGVKKPKPAEIGEYLNYTPPPAKYEKPQIRLAMPGGVREVPTLEPLPVETTVDTETKSEWEVVPPEEYLKDQNPAVPGVETPLQKAYSTISNETKNLPLEALNVSNSPLRGAVPSTIVCVLPNDAS